MTRKDFLKTVGLSAFALVVTKSLGGGNSAKPGDASYGGHTYGGQKAAN